MNAPFQYSSSNLTWPGSCRILQMFFSRGTPDGTENSLFIGNPAKTFSKVCLCEATINRNGVTSVPSKSKKIAFRRITLLFHKISHQESSHYQLHQKRV